MMIIKGANASFYNLQIPLLLVGCRGSAISLLVLPPSFGTQRSISIYKYARVCIYTVLIQF